MRNFFLLLFMLLLFSNTQAMRPEHNAWLDKSGEAIFPQAVLTLSRSQQNQVQAAEKFIIQSLNAYFPANTTLQLDVFKSSPIGTHISFTQAFLGLPIYGTSVKINIDKNGRVNSVLYKLVQTQNWPLQTSQIQIDKQAIQNIIGNFIISNANNCWYTNGEDGVVALQVEYGLNDGTNHTEALLAEDYSVIYQLDKHRYSGVKDTMVTGNVFFPDPLTSAHKKYGAPFVDADDSAIFALDYERVPLKMQASFLDDTFFLQNPYTQVVEMSTPSTARTIATIPFFNFSRASQSFEDVNAFYHIYNYRQHLKIIGFDTLGKLPLKIDTHALNGADNSEFDFFNNDLKLLFGEGGIDDAEDADVVVHEYSHFLSYQASGDNGYGSDRLAIEEGMADYFACSYSKNISAYNWQKVYSWDGNESWDGRSCVTSKNYKNDLSGNRYRDGEIWVGTLMEIQEQIGRNQTDALMISTLYMLAKYISMPNTAKLFIHADSVLNNGEHFYVIANTFIKNGLLPATYLSIEDDAKLNSVSKINSAYFQSTGLVYAEFEKPQSGVAKLMDIQGKEIITQNFSNTNKVNIYAPDVKPGIYILNISANGGQKSVKLLK